MMDRRLIASNGRVAAIALRGQVDAETFVDGWEKQVSIAFTDLCKSCEGTRERQLLLGDRVKVFEERDGWAFVQSGKDRYVGYVQINALCEPEVATHWVAVPAGHIYSEPDIKSAELGPLLLGARVACVTHQPGFHETTTGGYIPKQHIRPIDRTFSDPVTVAQMLFGAPYLWGGNSVRGIDCSGLVQAAHLACGTACPGDSDQQELSFGRYLDEDDELHRGDLIFWRGHVAIMVDSDTIIHANAHHMSVAYESLSDAIRRIEAQGDGPVTARKRL